MATAGRRKRPTSRAHRRRPAEAPRWNRRPNTARRAALLEAVSAFLLDEGLGEFTLRRAAAAAGTSAQLLVHYFGTRERLVAEALTSISAGWIGSVFDRNDMALGNFDELYWRAWRSFTTDAYLQHLRLMYDVLSAAFRNPAPYQRVLDGVTLRWQTRFADSLLGVGVSDTNARRISTLYLAALRGLLVDLLATGDLGRVNDAATLLLENLKRDVMGALRSPEQTDVG